MKEPFVLTHKQVKLLELMYKRDSRKFRRWNISSQQIQLLHLISKTKNIGIESRRNISEALFGHIRLETRRGQSESLKELMKKKGLRTDLAFYYDESNFNKTIKSLMDKDLIYRKKENIISKGNVIKKYCYYLTKKGKMFLKII